jgi:transposase
MVTARKSRKSRTSRRSQKFNLEVLGRPDGVIQPRVQAVGPERFGVVPFDCAKLRSKWMLANFYGNVLIPPTDVEHQRIPLELAIAQLREALRKHDIADVIVCIEMTGSYHLPVVRAFRKAGFEVRIVHPFASRHYRVAEHGDLKTDDHDLAGIFRAAINGFGLVEKPLNPLYQELQVVSRHRRDLVTKRSKLQCQIRHYLELCLPGFTELFPREKFWTQKIPVPLLEAIASRGGSLEVILQADEKELARWLKDGGIRVHKRTIQRVMVWAAGAAASDSMAASYARVWISLLADWQAKQREITELERRLAGLLAQTPYLLLLSHPGINVVCGSELAAELGPIENYASCKSISGRAGLYPSRYQSDQVDRGGKLSKFRNARLRQALLLAADNVIACNMWWNEKAAKWRDQGHGGRDIRCRVANRLTRTIYKMVSGRQLYRHASRLDRAYVLEKLMTFQRERNAPPIEVLAALEHAAEMIPVADRREEAVPLQAAYAKSKRSRRGGPQAVGALLVPVLARLGITGKEADGVEST